MRALLIGDVVGAVGLRALLATLPALRAEHRPDLVVVNAENAADGTGTSARQARELLDAGVDVLTGGNHTMRRSDYHAVLREEPRALRPENLLARGEGGGLAVVDTPAGPAAVVNVLGAVFMDAVASPFAIVDDLVDRAREAARHVFVDVHAEATSEKVALGWHLAGRVSAVVGTHTHVPTADGRVLPGGTAYLTDLGMTGPHDSVIGVRTDIIVNRFLTGAPARFVPAEGGVRVQGAVVACDADGRATSIARVDVPVDPVP
ncbi:MAG TPA: TIGR00282 family metallophosphoesterase [Miltoncostaeaceae bacterium]|nr:TIGR00282 family metallophosphoesterase [Miltoncostaeaceae bacterium]